MRQKRVDSINSELKRRKNEIIESLKNKIEENEEVEKKLLESSGKDDIKLLEHEDFFARNNTELKAFIMARQKDVPISKLSKKGKVAAAIGGEKNLLSVSFDLRESPVIYYDQLLLAESEREHVGLEQNDDISHREVIVSQHHTHLKSSVLLADNEWIDRAKMIFGQLSATAEREISDDEIKKADILQKILLTRLEKHIRRRIVEEKKRDHWCLKWAERNMAQVAAIMIILNHVKDDCECLDEQITLLKSSNFFVSANSDEMKNGKHGAYLYFDANNMAWVRSGKVTGRGFSVRHAEHEKKAAAKRTASRFYLCYPTSTCARNKSASRKGYFDNLQQFVAVGFNIDDDGERDKVMTGELEKGGIFSFNDEETSKIDKLSMRGRSTTVSK